MSRRLGLGGALFFAALAATVVASVLVVRARTPDLVLEVLKPGRCYSFNPDAKSGARGVEIEFFVRRSDPAAAVEIVDSEEGAVDTLDAAVSLEEGEPVSYDWHGEDAAGGTVPEGRYRLAVALPESDRFMVWPLRISVVRGDAVAADEKGDCGAL